MRMFIPVFAMSSSFRAHGVHGPLACVYENALDLGVVIQGLEAHLSAEAGLLVAAEWEAGEGGEGGVDGDDARFDLSGHSVGPAQVTRPEGAREAVDHIVCQLHGLGLGG